MPSQPATWLMKTEPSTFSFEQLVKDGKTFWDGVRNHQAQKFMKQMAVGDRVLIYHSVTGKAVVGLAEVTQTASPDPTAGAGENWIGVTVKPVRTLKTPVTLAEIKQHPALQEIGLVRQGRLSVMPLLPKEFEILMEMAGETIHH